MDDRAVYEDVQVYIDDNEVYIRQWNEKNQHYELVILSHKMFDELQIAMDTSEGLYKVED
jgi:phenylacetate-coenzyme A ligase PaaK-like adenylate-forming protein